MRTTKYALLPLLAIFFLILSCKRELDLTASSLSAPNSGKKPTTWIEAQSLNKGPADIPEWNKTKRLGSNNSISITPVKISGYEKKESNTVIKKVFVISENMPGENSVGEYIYLIDTKPLASGNKDNTELSERLSNIAANSFQRKSIGTDFNGIVLRYSLNYDLVESANFANGEKNNDLVKLIAKEDGGKNSEVPSFAEPPCGVCIDWYIQTIDLETGQVLSEIYLYTQCGNQGCEGGGGGGNGIPPSVEAGLDQFANSAYATSIKRPVMEVYVNAETIIRYYNWKCVEGVGWSIRSSEKGTLKKVPNSNPADWRFQSVVHETHGVEGIYTLVSITPEVQNYNAIVGLYNFSTSFTLKVTYSMLFKGFPLTRVKYYPCQIYFNINEGIE